MDIGKKSVYVENMNYMCSANLSVTFLWTCQNWKMALDEKPFYFAPRLFLPLVKGSNPITSDKNER